ncbi:hypothetical protein ACF0H5_020514 [Mactra antiquata]
MMKLWMTLVVLRILWSIIPQTGYIHPDEFFQTVEPLAGDVFNISIERTWEYETYQLRSVTLTQLVFRPIFMLLSYLERSTSFILSGYHIIAAYRFLMTVLSLFIDASVYEICILLDLPYQTALTFLASSYVMLTFQTHTFSNSFEALLTTILLVFILKCKKGYNDENRLKNEHVHVLTDDDDNNSNDGDDMCDLDSSFNNLHRVAFELRKRNISGQSARKISCEKLHSDTNKTKNQDEPKNSTVNKNVTEKLCSGFMYTAFIAVTLVVGVFNRPTFVLFSFLPCLWWLWDFFSNVLLLIKRGLVFLLVAMATTLVFILVDTLYHKNISLHEFLMNENWVQNTVIVPINFILYNSVPTNLASHGLHPFYVHFTVNMPLLYLPFLFCIVKSFIHKYLPSKFKFETVSEKNEKRHNHCVQNVSYVFLCFVYFPVLCLSIFPHQEARFLTPLLSFVVICVVTLQQKFSKIFWLLFVMFNLSLSIIFGVLHQGGMIPCLLYIQQYYKSNINDNNTLHVVFSHTYMPPKHLLLSSSSNLKLYDFKGENLEHVYDKIVDIKSQIVNDSNSNKNDKIFLALPGTVISRLESQYSSGLSYTDVVTFFPHLSFEDLPVFNTIDSMSTLYDELTLMLINIHLS